MSGYGRNDDNTGVGGYNQFHTETYDKGESMPELLDSSALMGARLCQQAHFAGLPRSTGVPEIRRK